MAETINIDRNAIEDLQRIKEEFDSIMESIELMSDEEFTKSYKKSKGQIEKREFADWDAL